MIPAVHPEKRFSSFNKNNTPRSFRLPAGPGKHALRPSVKPRNQALTLSHLSPTKQNPPPFPHGSDLELLTRNICSRQRHYGPPPINTSINSLTRDSLHRSK